MDQAAQLSPTIRQNNAKNLLARVTLVIFY